MKMRFKTNVYLLSFSAFFADMGYQIVIGGLSIFLVIVLGAPVWVFALIESLSYGFGAVFSYIGGRLADSHDAKSVTILGNALIPMMSFIGMVGSYVTAGALYIGGWWSRNFRSPPRRILIMRSTSEQERSSVFGLLHGLDVGGGMIAALLLVVLVGIGYPLREIFIISLAPLVISTLLVVSTRKVEKPTESDTRPDSEAKGTGNRTALLGIFLATAFFGFSTYSIGFPILTAAQSGNSIIHGLILYPIFMAASASGGFIYSRISVKKEIRMLGYLGYILSGIGTLSLALVFLFRPEQLFYYIAIIILGFGVAGVETFEPTIVSKIVKGARAGSGMGTLTSFRSIGLFSSNIAVGLLYTLSPAYSYFYAGLVAIIGGITILVAGRNYMR